MNLIELDKGKKARIVELQGGQQLLRRLDEMGIRPGCQIVKKSAALMRGPIVLQNGPVQMAIGYGMAKRIIVEPIDK